MDSSTLLLGIDIGWSKKNRSCAFAANDPLRRISWPKSSSRYGTAHLGCCRFTLTELLLFLDDIRVAMRDYERTIVVLDGPLGPLSRPTSNRYVDSKFRCGEFRYRMQPTDIETKSGQIYVDTTYQVAERLGRTSPAWVSGSAKSAFVLAETNPTVGLALMVQKFDVAEIPSRKRPIMPPKSRSTKRAIKAKSDFYWRVGGNEVCGDIVGITEMVDETNHENVAGLYCLAVASALGSDEAISCGDQRSGVYVFPDRIATDWETDLKDLGIVSGTIKIGSRPSQKSNFEDWSHASNLGSMLQEKKVTMEVDPVLPEDELEVLLLNDNGCVWGQHNDWLEGVSGPVTV